MTTFLVEAMLARLKTNLEAIGDGSTTWATSTTHRIQVTRDKVNTAAPKWHHLIAMRHTERSERIGVAGTTNKYQTTCDITLDVMVEAATWNPDTDNQAWVHDLYKALRDHTVGGTASSLTVTAITPVVPSEAEDPRCKVRATLEVWLCFMETDPSVRV